ncbi:MAG: hypothetical protein V4596_06785 [Bdellovibrionota bacterium]
MLKLNNIRELKKDEESEGDLKGLNHDQLIQNTKPYVFMAIKNVDIEIIYKISEIFHLLVEQSNNEEWILVLQNKSENFKEDALILTAAAIVLTKFDSGCSVFVGVSQLLRALLSQSNKPQKDLSVGEQLEINGCSYQDAILTLSPWVQLILKQSGIHCVTSDKNRMLADRVDIEKLLHEFTNDTNTVRKYNLEKVG